MNWYRHTYNIKMVWRASFHVFFFYLWQILIRSIAHIDINKTTLQNFGHKSSHIPSIIGGTNIAMDLELLAWKVISLSCQLNIASQK